MSGLPLVVEIWGNEYKVLQSRWTEHKDHPGFPRLGHWGTRKDNKANILVARQRLDTLAWDQICLHPWGVTDEGWLPEMVHARYVTSRRVLLEDNLDRSWYLGERVFDFDRGVAARRVPRAPPKLMFWGADLPDDV
ncbi:hypothetical protein M5689_008268 [Euphorbia peplus]|nr:hypothetical protein M5689_008268 [Euphorbia peplus]